MTTFVSLEILNTVNQNNGQNVISIHSKNLLLFKISPCARNKFQFKKFRQNSIISSKFPMTNAKTDPNYKWSLPLLELASK